MSKTGLAILVAVGLGAATAQAADAPFVGYWKLDPAKSRLPDRMVVEAKGGQTYAFDFGDGPETIVVDGTDQKGEGGTQLSVKPQAPDTWIVERKQGGRRLLTATWKLSRDGRTLTDEFRQVGPDMSMDYVYRRTGRGSGFAGDWRSVRETMNSPVSLQVTPFQGDGLAFASVESRVTRNVRFDGADYPDAGENARPGSASSVRRLDARDLVITGKSNGKVTFTEDVKLSADLKTLTLIQHFPGRDQPNVLVFRRA
jgi:hypothetical protein